MESLALKSKEPLYIQLANILRRKILLGEYKPGDKLPTETQTSNEYEVSLMTVKKAFYELVNENLVLRRPKIGTIVLSPETKDQNKKTLNCLKIAHLSSTEEVDEMIKNIFEKENKNWKLRLRIVSEQQFPSILSETRESDLIVFNPFWFRKIYNLNLLVEVTQYLENSKTISKNSYFRKAIEPFQFDGQIYGLPQNFNLTMLYCNKKLFRNKGITPFEMEWNWRNFKEVAERLTSHSVWGLGYFPYSPALWENFLLQDKGRLFNRDYTRFLIDSPQSLNAFSFLKELIVGKKCGINLDNIPQLSEFLKDNKVAMVISGPYLNKILGEKIGDWSVFPLPKGKIFATSSVSYGVGITKFSKNPEICWKFLELYCGRIGQSLLGETFHVMPSLKKAAKETFLKSEYPLENKSSFICSSEFAFPIPFILSWNKVNAIMSSGLGNLFSKEKKTEDVLGNLKEQVENALAEFKSEAGRNSGKQEAYR